MISTEPRLVICGPPNVVTSKEWMERDRLMRNLLHTLYYTSIIYMPHAEDNEKECFLVIVTLIRHIIQSKNPYNPYDTLASFGNLLVDAAEAWKPCPRAGSIRGLDGLEAPWKHLHPQFRWLIICRYMLIFRCIESCKVYCNNAYWWSSPTFQLHHHPLSLSPVFAGTSLQCGPSLWMQTECDGELHTCEPEFVQSING